MITFCYLNKMFRDETNKLTHAQLVINNRFDLGIKTKIVEVEQLKDIYRKNKDNKNFICDFSVDGTLLSCDTSTPVAEINSAYSAELTGSENELKPEIANIYELFIDIVDSQGLYIDYTKHEVLGTEEMLSGVVRMIPNFSKTTMTVSLSVPLEDGWKSRKLIYAEEGILKTSNFYFMVEKQYANVIEKYDVDFIKECNLKGKHYVIYEYTGNVSIYGYLGNDFKVFPALVNRYVYMQELYSMYIANAKFLKEIYGIQEEEVISVNKERTPRDYSSRYTQSYVCFEPSFKPISKNSRIKYLNDITGTVIPGIGSGWKREDLVRHIQEMGFNEIQRLNYIHILEFFLASEGDQSSLVNKCDLEIDYYNKLKFKAGNFLYALRSCMFIFNKGYRKNVALKGSDVPSSTFLRIGGLSK
ncbi:hypothetical protein UT300012_23230 [Paraclostridium bifermentans]